MSITRTSHGPTVVLVHGAFAESSRWDGVVDLLLEDDFPVQTQRPIPGAALAEPSGTPARRTIPSWFPVGTGDRNIPVDALRSMAERAGSQRTVELQSGTHAVAVTEGAAVAGLIGEAAGAAASRSDGRVDFERVGVAA
jgi:pimeloyl-ACP methyl ester carboxylesterase